MGFVLSIELEFLPTRAGNRDFIDYRDQHAGPRIRALEQPDVNLLTKTLSFEDVHLRELL
jgi:hypothetical protein